MDVKKSFIFSIIFTAVTANAFGQVLKQEQESVATKRIAPVVQAIRKSLDGSSRLSVCSAMQLSATKPKTNDEVKKRNEAIRIINQKNKKNDPSMLHARADIYRKGLYGFSQDQDKAFKLYSVAKSADAGFNAALMLFQKNDLSKNQDAAKKTLAILKNSGAIKTNSKGVTGSQAHYIAGLIYEFGYAGAIDLKSAFEHYKISARNTYVPGVYRYLKFLVESLPYLSDSERVIALQEVRMMSNRWRFYSHDIMKLTGDLYAANWLPDDGDGFFAQYYWRISQVMQRGSEINGDEVVFTGRIKKLSKEKEERLNSAVKAAKRNIINKDNSMEFVDLCVD